MNFRSLRTPPPLRAFSMRGLIPVQQTRTRASGTSAAPDSQSTSPYCYYAETLAAANQPVGTSATILNGATNITLGTWSSSGSSGTFTPLGAGNYANAVKVTVGLNALPTFTPMLKALIRGANFTNIGLSATATAAFLQWPTQLTFNMVGVKGWYYKTITLYALPFTGGVASTTYTDQFGGTTAQWVYQPQHFTNVSGTGNVNVGPDIANKQTTLNLGSLGSGYGVTTGPTGPLSPVNLGQYADLFMVESVMQGPCPPSKPWTGSDFSSNNSYSFPTSCYATQAAAQQAGISSSKVWKEPVGWTVCSESQTTSGPAYASYNSICNPNTASTPTSSQTSSNPCFNSALGTNGMYVNCNSSYTNPWQFTYVNFFPAQTAQNTNVFSTSVSAATSFPCGQTVGHEWEDGGSTLPSSYSASLSNAISASKTPAQDFFYTVFTTCGAQPGVAQSGYYSATPSPQLVL